MRIWRFLYLTAGFLLAGCLGAGAQDKGKAGVSIGYPGGIGILWHATDSVAVRPEFSFNRNSTDGTTGGTGWGIGTGLSVLFYLKKYDNVRTYISPRVNYTRSSSTLQVTSPPAGIPELKSTSTATGGAGVFGAQYSASSRFSVFGELGLAFSHRRSESSLSTQPPSTGNAFGTTAGVGVVFYP
jgi:hypothetical protein